MSEHDVLLRLLDALPPEVRAKWRPPRSPLSVHGFQLRCFHQRLEEPAQGELIE